MSLLIELQYFPSLIVCKTLLKNTNIDFCIYENYRRRSFRNRCIIAGANGPISLSVPIAGGRNQKAIYKDVKIDYTVDWQQQHWRSIFSAYGKSPWFFQYSDSLEKLYSGKTALLFEWNLLCLDWINRSLGLSLIPAFSKTDIQETKNKEDETAVILDWRDQVLPANYQDARFGPFQHYSQVFEERIGFQPNLSILDTLFCCGKSQTIKLLQ